MKFRFDHFALSPLWIVGLAIAGMLGCDQAAPPAVVTFEPNFVFAKRWEQATEIPTDQFITDSRVLITEWFGTPDNPKLPELLKEDDYAELISLEVMKPAIGPAVSTSEPGATGLYQQLCVSCHGETGQGRGLVAASQNPYPRDFRRGVFKYKVTNRNSKPLKSDLYRTLHDGLSGTQMPVFNKLSKGQLDALVEYVIFLSIRGEFERKLIQLGAEELDPDTSFDSDVKKRQRIYDYSLVGATDEVSKKALKEQVELANDLLMEVVDRWIDAEDAARKPALPTFPVVGLTTEESGKAQLADSIAKGKELFKSLAAGCSKCHGESAKGDGLQLPDYDDWTKEWTKNIGIDYNDIEATTPFLALGALKPQPLAPRNIVEGKFRGGRDPLAVHHRILHGIEGSPMPAAAIITAPGGVGVTSDEVWHLVNYVLSVQSPL